MFTVLQNANLALSFFLELAVLAAVGWWGFATGSNLAVKPLLGIGAPLALALLWAAFGSPKPMVVLPAAVLVGFTLVWFGVGAVALAATAGLSWGIALAVMYLINAGLAAHWQQ